MVDGNYETKARAKVLQDRLTSEPLKLDDLPTSVEDAVDLLK